MKRDWWGIALLAWGLCWLLWSLATHSADELWWFIFVVWVSLGMKIDHLERKVIPPKIEVRQ